MFQSIATINKSLSHIKRKQPIVHLSSWVNYGKFIFLIHWSFMDISASITIITIVLMVIIRSIKKENKLIKELVDENAELKRELNKLRKVIKS